MIKNKKGLEMIWSTLIAMILAFTLLALLIFFFTSSSGGFFDTIRGYFSKTNVDSVAKGCDILADTGNFYSYCCEKKQVKYYLNGSLKEGDFSCGELLNQSFAKGQFKVLECEGVAC
jgi:hypothetical protein